MNHISGQTGYDVMKVSTDAIIPIKDLGYEDNKKLIIFDDYVCEKNQRQIVHCVIQGRHKNCSVIYLSQSFYKTPRDIRLNCSHFCIYELPSSRERNMISSELGVDKEKFKKATKKPFSFLYVDKPRKIVKRNFTGELSIYNLKTKIMGIFNQHSDNQPQQQRFLRGLQGSPGVGFSLTKDGNYDMNNRKLKNVGEGVESSDAVTKHRLEVSLNTKLDNASLNNYVKKDSPEVGGDLDMKGHLIKNLKVTSLGGDASATSKKYVDQKLNTKADKTSLTRYVKKNSPELGADLDMKGFEVKNMRLTPAGDLSATSKKYVDSKVNNKANKRDLNDYLKLDGTSQMQGNLEMNNNRITRLPEPQLADEPATKRYITLTNNKFYSNFLDLQGTAKMLGNLQMNDHRITGLTNPPNNDDEATNKKYVDDNITKSHIKPSHTPKNVFQYLMNDVNEWSSEYGIKVDKFIDLHESPHSWDKRVLKVTPVKNGSNYRFRLGLQMFRMKTNETYSLMVERYNRDYNTWQREQTVQEYG